MYCRDGGARRGRYGKPMQGAWLPRLLVGMGLALAAPWLGAATLEVGPGKAFARLEEANAKAQAGDTILVYPAPQPYAQVAVFVRLPRLTFRAVPAAAGGFVALSGSGYDYSGAGSVPRAIFQFNRGADGCVLEGFELSGAHNSSHNGAGVRINQANQVTVRHCYLHGNDMGVMSNGDGTAQTAVDQLFEFCLIARNGDRTEPGYNHNLYLGGTSVRLRGCEIYGALTGHNLKSRAHLTWVETCYLHDSANRECDLVDAADTEHAGSDAVLLGNVIVKDPKCPGNHGVIHFGQDGKRAHDGTLYLVHNTIVTPFAGPVLELSAPAANAVLVNNLVTTGAGSAGAQTLAVARAGSDVAQVTGMGNWFDRGYATPGGTGLAPGANHFGQHLAAPFRDPAHGDYHATTDVPTGSPLEGLKLPQRPASPAPAADPVVPLPALDGQYASPASVAPRPPSKTPTVGAYEAAAR